MKSSRFKNNVSILFLTIFLSMKVAGLHALTHTDDNNHALHCIICNNVNSHSLTAALTPSDLDFNIENTEFIVQNEVATNYSFNASSATVSYHLFSRPPPFLL